MKSLPQRKAGQAMVEYIIIVVVVAIACLVIFGLFSDTLKDKMSHAVEELGGDTSQVDDTDSKSYLQDLGSGSNDK